MGMELKTRTALDATAPIRPMNFEEWCEVYWPMFAVGAVAVGLFVVSLVLWVPLLAMSVLWVAALMSAGALLRRRARRASAALDGFGEVL